MPPPRAHTIGMTMAALALVCAGLAAQKRTVWDGVYMADQASRGATAYRTTCAGCHGPDLSGNGTAPSLSAESFFFQWSDTTVADLFKRIKTAMPPDQPDSLSPETYRDIVAFLLEFNKVPAGQVALDTDPQSLEQIAITAAR